MKQVHKCIEAFSNSNNAKSALKDRQRTANQKPLGMLKPNATRWWSVFMATGRLELAREHLDVAEFDQLVQEHLTEQEWEFIHQ
jgi:hypothetical protein